MRKKHREMLDQIMAEAEKKKIQQQLSSLESELSGNVGLGSVITSFPEVVWVQMARVPFCEASWMMFGLHFLT